MSVNENKKVGLKERGRILLYFLSMANKMSKTYIPLMLAHTFFKALAPFITIIVPKFMIDELMGQRRIEVFVVLVTILAVGNFVINLISRCLEKVLVVKNLEVEQGFDQMASEHAASIDYKYLEDPEILDLKERAFFAIYNHGAIKGLIESFANLLTEFVTLVGVVGLILLLDLYMIAIVLVLIALNGVIYDKIQKGRFKEAQENVTDNRVFGYMATLTQDFSIAKDVRLYNISPLIMERSQTFHQRIVKVNSKYNIKEGKLVGFSDSNSQLQMILVYGYLAFKVLFDNMGLGDFTMYANAIRQFSQSVTQLVAHNIEISRCCYYLSLYMDYEEMVGKSQLGYDSLAMNNNHCIEFKDVAFRYPNSSQNVLQGINVTINAGETLSIVGLNGAGKTTFIKLLTRLYEPTEGEILLDGKNIQSYDYQEYMRLFSVVFQDFKLLAYSLRENITLDVNNESNDHKIKEILGTAGLMEDLNHLEMGLETPVHKAFDESGKEFSGGQQQKIAISRAIYKDGPIVILDEPTAALDPVSEYEIYNKFHTLTKNKTAIYISHRLSSCRFSDRILVFNQGRVIEEGPHDTLLEHDSGLYQEMWQAQARYYA